ncbi:hypothetical protein AVBRAN12640_05285 [Campylobacter sp. RM12640]|uniref:hypothetical protein n=1 Tax=unclassified Campylobacter TaxID=2593542 RepID=UPI0030142690|nr:hypothetical protein [Campylobacter sp. RM12640]MBZ7990047.1 hypothetical protein [Campylobacter sp. RM12635]
MLGNIEINGQKYDVRKPKVKDIKGLDLAKSDDVMELSKRCIIGLAPAEVEECELGVLIKASKLIGEYVEKNL